MTKNWEKYIKKNPYKNEIKSIIENIVDNNFSWYDFSKLKWYKNYYRIRKWKIRIVFIINSSWNKIVAIDTRWDIYKKI